MKNQILIIGLAALALYLWYKSGVPAGNAAALSGVDGFENDGVTSQNVGAQGSTVMQSGVNGASNVANSGLNNLGSDSGVGSNYATSPSYNDSSTSSW